MRPAGDKLTGFVLFTATTDRRSARFGCRLAGRVDDTDDQVKKRAYVRTLDVVDLDHLPFLGDSIEILNPLDGLLNVGFEPHQHDRGPAGGFDDRE